MRFSVIIPTFQRRDVVVASVRALASVAFDDFEAIVVVDGSTDGTTETLRRLSLGIPFTVIDQPNLGAAAARNRGAAASSGEILCFLDDDMEADVAMLAEHERSHRDGAHAVIGHIPVHPDSPRNFLSEAVANSIERRCARLSDSSAEIGPFDLLTGQLSLSREVFTAVGGFDPSFTHGGTFGNEDLDFGCRLIQSGYRIVFNPRAISRQRYVVTVRRHLWQWSHVGGADVAFARRHPEHADALFALRYRDERITRRVIRPLAAVPLLGALAARLGTWALLLLARAVPRHRRMLGVFARVRALIYWRAVRAAGGIPAVHPVRILVYHAIRDLSHDPVLRRYGVPPTLLRRQLSMLARAGFHFVSGAEVRRLMRDGGGIPRRAVLLTFDDAYQDVTESVLPILQEYRAPAITFAVTGCVGATNRWDERIGASSLPLASAAALRSFAGAGMEVGAHSRTHGRLIRMERSAVVQEVAGALDDLEAMGLPRPLSFAYPYGEHNAVVRAVATEAGVGIAFSLDRGMAVRGGDPLCVPRTEIGCRDTGWRFLWTVWRMRGSSPA